MRLRRIWTRGLKPLLAFGIAVLAASFSAMWSFGLDFPRDNEGFAMFLSLWLTGSIFVALLAGLPTLIIVLAIRFFRLPRPWSEVIGGLVAGPVIYVLTLLSQDISWDRFVSIMSGDEWFRFAVPGAVGGFVYWLAVGLPATQQGSLRKQMTGPDRRE